MMETTKKIMGFNRRNVDYLILRSSYKKNEEGKIRKVYITHGLG